MLWLEREDRSENKGGVLCYGADLAGGPSVVTWSFALLTASHLGFFLVSPAVVQAL